VLRGHTTSVLGLSNLGRTAVSPPARRTAAPLPAPVPVPTVTAPVHLPPVHFPPQPPVRTARAAQAGGFPGSYGPQDIASLYGAPASATGAGQQVSVIAEGDLSQPKADLVTFENQFGLPHVTWNQIQV